MIPKINSFKEVNSLPPREANQINKLPEDIFAHIFSYLGPIEQQKMRLVHHIWKSVSNHQQKQAYSNILNALKNLCKEPELKGEFVNRLSSIKKEQEKKSFSDLVTLAQREFLIDQ